MPQPIIEVVIVLHPHPLVLLGDILSAHAGLANSQGISFPLCEYPNHGSLVDCRHLGIGVGKTRTHNVGPGEDEPDGPLVHHLLGEEEGVLVQQPQGWAPSFVMVPKNWYLLAKHF